MDHIQYKKEKRIGLITLNRPEKRNALSGPMIEELTNTLKQAETDPDVKILLIRATGPAFSAGADLADLERLQNNSPEENLRDSQKLMTLFYQIYKHPRLVISQVEGPAIAGGCGLASICDLCYATPEASFSYSEVKIGFIPALVSVFLSRKIGEGRARQYLLTGHRISAAEAVSSGLITGLFPEENITEKVWEKALQLADSTSGTAVTLTKQLLTKTAGMTWEEALNLAAAYNANARSTADCQAGIRAFLAKEKIKW